jgi:hypothetical protein
MGVEEYESEVVKKAINGIDDFETTNFYENLMNLYQTSSLT